MKQETKELITGLKNWYEKFRSEAPLTPYTEWAVGDGEGYADEGASNMDKVIALLDNLEDLENQPHSVSMPLKMKQRNIFTSILIAAKCSGLKRRTENACNQRN